jgi:hypothetical protein
MASNAPQHVDDEELDDLEPIEGVEFLSRAEWMEMLDRETRRAFGLTAREFATKFRRGEFVDHDQHVFASFLGMLLPEDFE